MGYYKFGPQCQAPILGEIMEEYLGQLEYGTFVDVGAYDGMVWSNTYGLARAGWRGLLVEPQADMLALAGRRLAGLNCDFVTAAVSDYNGEGVLYLGGSLTTMSEHQRAIYLQMPWSASTGLAANRTVRVQVRTLRRLLDERGWPNSYELLSLDVEGEEHNVLAAADLNIYRPKIAIVETHAKFENLELAEKARIIDRIMDSYSYEDVYSDHINTIYVAEEVIYPEDVSLRE